MRIVDILRVDVVECAEHILIQRVFRQRDEHAVEVHVVELALVGRAAVEITVQAVAEFFDLASVALLMTSRTAPSSIE